MKPGIEPVLEVLEDVLPNVGAYDKADVAGNSDPIISVEDGTHLVALSFRRSRSLTQAKLGCSSHPNTLELVTVIF
ncbi:hypothetical protein JAAARDRAFT_490084 [Jaapia argillacea MUCL 33604]|uniref:Uncharacterized protein n=1 Tax=Jaapia argillacea MUCL 33604 TaxID=933084 RepID=A0A067PB14_9AGAM|nr:hypothetical protein JAAARDRAFT_490084 [Jaapia argillacea MUCL 33604]